MWVLAIGMLIGNVTSLYAAEVSTNPLIIEDFWNQPSAVKLLFISNLQKFNDLCLQSSDTTSCSKLNQAISKGYISSKRCEIMLKSKEISEKDKKTFANTYVEIKCNPILDDTKNLETPAILKQYLSEGNLLSLIIQENDPKEWSSLHYTTQANKSIQAIKSIDEVLKKFTKTPQISVPFGHMFTMYLILIKQQVNRNDEIKNDVIKNKNTLNNVANFAITTTNQQDSEKISQIYSMLNEELDHQLPALKTLSVKKNVANPSDNPQASVTSGTQKQQSVKLLSEQEKKDLSSISQSNPSEKRMVTFIYDIDNFFASGAQNKNSNLFSNYVINISQYTGHLLKPYIAKIINNPIFQATASQITNQLSPTDSKKFGNA